MPTPQPISTAASTPSTTRPMTTFMQGGLYAGPRALPRLTPPDGVARLRAMSSESLPEYRVKAHNTSSTSENAIHSDETARRYGFSAALVPGVTLYAYVTRPIVETLGAAWL